MKRIFCFLLVVFLGPDVKLAVGLSFFLDLGWLSHLRDEITHMVQLGGNVLDGCLRERKLGEKDLFSFFSMSILAQHVCLCVCKRCMFLSGNYSCVFSVQLKHKS